MSRFYEREHRAHGVDIRLGASVESIVGDDCVTGVRLAQYDAVPWFWSNQYDLKVRTVGLSLGYDQAVMRGEPANGSFSIVYLKAGRVIALDCVNATRGDVQGRKLVEARSVIDPAKLADASIPLKEMLV